MKPNLVRDTLDRIADSLFSEKLANQRNGENPPADKIFRRFISLYWTTREIAEIYGESVRNQYAMRVVKIKTSPLEYSFFFRLATFITIGEPAACIISLEIARAELGNNPLYAGLIRHAILNQATHLLVIRKDE